jgi:nucleoside-diphosphate-sugar epimerase
LELGVLDWCLRTFSDRIAPPNFFINRCVNVFVTGGTGYIGSRLIAALVSRGHRVRALVRQGSEKKLPVGAEGVAGDPLKFEAYTTKIPPADTFVHLIGVPHPSPAKAKEFREIDLVSIQVAVRAARDAGVRHFIYLSVAQPAPMMKVFIEVRQQGEELLRASGIPATCVRPWYVLGPGHWWPYPLLPFYWIAERLPATRESARRLGLVTVRQVVVALLAAVEKGGDGFRIIDVPQIRALSSSYRG